MCKERSFKGSFLFSFKCNIDEESLYSFNYIKFEENEKTKCKDTWDTLVDFLDEQCHGTPELVFVFEDSTRYFGDKTDEILHPYIEHVGKEQYYLIDKEVATKELLKIAAREADGMWHFMIICTQCNINGKGFSQELFPEICEQANMIVLGAYDGDGFVIWEKNSD